MAGTSRDYVRDEGGRGLRDMAAMQEARESGKCPFCEIIAGEKPDQSVIHQTAHWAVFENIRPEDGAGLHLTVAAKIPRGHVPDLTFDGLRPGAVSELGPLIQDLGRRFEIEKGRSVFMRIDPTGDFTASTVFHPCWHLVVSDGLPVTQKDIDPMLLELLEERRADIVAAFFEAEPELFEKAARKSDAAVWVEALKYFMMCIGLVRSEQAGKAREIRPKLSNKVG